MNNASLAHTFSICYRSIAIHQKIRDFADVKFLLYHLKMIQKD